MDETRKAQLAYALTKYNIRKKVTFDAIPKIQDEAKSLAKEHEMSNIRATPEEITEFLLKAIEDIFSEVIAEEAFGKK